jgi:hypothetical protein
MLNLFNVLGTTPFQSLVTPAASVGSFSGLLLAADFGSGGSSASPFRLTMQACFCVLATTATSFYLQMNGGGTTIACVLNFGASTLDLTARRLL